jgi:hypothetical protein
MTLPASGAISTNNINVELRFAATAVITLNDAPLRSLAGKPSGSIALGNFYSLQSRLPLSKVISANTNNYTFSPASVAGYIAGITDATLTIGSGVVVGSASTGSFGLTISGWAAGDRVYLVNNGYIVGAGGNGNGGAGGPALSTSIATFITNNGTIGGGGGAGGGSQAYSYSGGGHPPSTVYVAAVTGGGGAGSVAGSPGGTLTAGGGGGGGGGALGAAGGSSTWGGGAAGAATSGNAKITWVTAGTRLGALN